MTKTQELEVVAWRGVRDGISRKYTGIKRVSEVWADQGLTITPLVDADAVSDTIKALEAEMDSLKTQLHLKSGILDLELDARRKAEAERDALRNRLDDIIRADDENTGAEPSVSVLARAIDNARQALGSRK